MIVPNKAIVTFEGRVYGPGDWVPDPPTDDKEEEITPQNIDEVIDKVWEDRPKKCKK